MCGAAHAAFHGAWLDRQCDDRSTRDGGGGAGTLGVLVVALVCVVLSGGMARAWAQASPAPGDQQVMAGVAGAQQGDMATARRLFEAAAALGNAGAKYNLAVIHRSGQGVTQDGERAAGLLFEAAEAGNPMARCEVGFLAEQSDDRVAAVLLYRRAAAQGDTAAQSRLGDFSCRGDHVRHDPAEGLRLWRRAADAGHASSQFKLGMAYPGGAAGGAPGAGRSCDHVSRRGGHATEPCRSRPAVSPGCRAG
jgi:hypothetical protein